MAEKIRKSQEILKEVVTGNDCTFLPKNAAFVVDTRYYTEMPHFMEFYRKIAHASALNALTVQIELPQCLELLKRLDMAYNHLLVQGQYGMAIEHTFIKINVYRLIMLHHVDLEKIIQSQIKISKLLYALKFYRDALYYCTKGLISSGRVEFLVVKELCEQKLSEQNIHQLNVQMQAPHLDSKWNDRLRTADCFIQNNLPYSYQAFLERTNALLELENIFQKRIVENCRQRCSNLDFCVDQSETSPSASSGGGVINQNERFADAILKSIVDFAIVFQSGEPEKPLDVSEFTQTQMPIANESKETKKKKSRGGRGSRAKRYEKRKESKKATSEEFRTSSINSYAATKSPSSIQSAGISLSEMKQNWNWFYCFLCDKIFTSLSSYDEHTKTRNHQYLLSVDQKKSWIFPKPRSAQPYVLCDKKFNIEKCICKKAHSEAEIAEWTERVAFVRNEATIKRNESGLNEILDRIGKAKAKSDVVVKCLPSVADVSIVGEGSSEVRLNGDAKGKPYLWTISVTTINDHNLRNVLLADKRFLRFFRIMTQLVSPGIYRILIEFCGNNCVGTFTQEVLLDFGIFKLIGINLTVHVGLTDTAIADMAHLKQSLISDVCWNEDNCEIMWISKERLRPPLSEIVADLSFVLNESNYFTNMKKWLLTEELHRQKILSSFRLSSTAELQAHLFTDRGQIIWPPVEGCLFAEVRLDLPLSEDFDVYDLLSGNCQFAFVAMKETPDQKPRPDDVKRRVYEVNVVGGQIVGYEGLTQEHVVLCLSRIFVTDHSLHVDQKIQLEVQFNVSRKNFADWLISLEMMRKKELTHFIFPNLVKLFREYLVGKVDKEVYQVFPKLYTLEEKWKKCEMNSQQCKVLRHVAICAVNNVYPIPPLVIFGPFGTGKTRTIAEAVSLLLSEFPESRILICTQSNTTANLYLSNLEKCTQFSSDKLRQMLFRIFAKKLTKFENLPAFLKPYVRLTANGNLEELTVQALRSVRVVLCTLAMTAQLLKIFEANPDCPMFTHIFLDEAAQGLEAEVLMPLCMSTKKTCVVVAGDHYQIKPTIYLKEAKELSSSYLERLYYSYENQVAVFNEDLRNNGTIPQLLFNENYRSHPEILEFVSAEFYGNKSSLKSCCPILESSLKPMYFASAFGVEEKLGSGVSFSNQAETQEVLNQIHFFWDNWPKSWGDKDIGIIVPYYDQMKVIRAKVIAKYAGKIYVGKVAGAQGKEFKVLIISIVRGRNVLMDSQLENRNLGFLDDERLINTALTRARYCVVVVGDPLVMYNVGACKEIWQRYIEHCIDKKSFLPNTYSLDQLKAKSADLIQKFGLNEKRLKETQINVDAIIRQLVRKSNPGFSFQHDQTPLDETEIETCLKELNVEIESKEKSTPKWNGFCDSEEGVECILHISSSSVIYAKPKDRKHELIFMRGRKHCLTAFHEDIVSVRVTDRSPDNGKLYGFVLKVLEHVFDPSRKKFVCMADPFTFSVLTPLDPRIPRIVALKRERERKKGENVLIEYDVHQRNISFKAKHPLNLSNVRDKLYIVMFLKWTEGFYSPLGVIVDTIPQRKTMECSTKVLEINFDIERRFPDGADMQAKKIEKQFLAAATKHVRRLPDAYRKGREDLTKSLVCFTIDPPESLDLDDALSIQPGKDAETHIVGVHIADVTAFVEKDSELDEEAYRRGVTWYSCDADRTAYMFPEKLSSVLLSLLPNGEKATVSLFFEMNEKSGEIESMRCTRSIIVIRHSLTYPQVEDTLRQKTTSGNEEDLHKKLKLLHLLAKKQKSLRLGLAESMVVDYDVQQYFMAELLVSEWMVIANKYVAETIYQIFPSLCLLRRHVSPLRQMLDQWVSKFRTSAKNSLLYQNMVANEADNNLQCQLIDAESSLPDVRILTSTLNEIVEAKRSRDYAVLQALVCTEKVHPSIVPLYVEMTKIQEKSLYQTSGEAGDNTMHHGMNLKLYTHFTSPLRRYPDIVTHRLLMTALDESVDRIPYDEGTLATICRHCTEKVSRSSDYEREEFGLKLAVQVSKTPVQILAVVSKVDDVELNLEFPTLDKNVRHLKSLRYNHLQLRKNPVVDDEGSVELFWKKEIYPTRKEKVKMNSKVDKDGIVHLESEMYVTCFRAAHWVRLLEALENEDLEEINLACDDLSRNGIKKSPKDVCSDLYLKANKIYQQKLNASFIVKWSSATALKFQLSSKMHRGCLTPCLQLLRLTPTVNLCLEHVRESSVCFNGDDQRQATKLKYPSVNEYQNIWLPLLHLESAHASVNSGDAIRIHDVDGVWNYDPKHTRYQLELTFSLGFCQRREIQFSRIHCESVPTFLRCLVKLDYFCVEVPIKHENGEYIFLAHCVSTFVKEEKKFLSNAEFSDEFHQNENVVTVSCVLTYCSTEFPEHLLGQPIVCNVELLKTPRTLLRMQNALLDLLRANQLVTKIISNNSKFSASAITSSMSKNQLHEWIRKIDCTLNMPNEDQIKAIFHALTNEFSLIWGPPGTGKTDTAVRLACCIAKFNKLCKKGRSTLVYCAPSNKAVNVVGKKFVQNVREKEIRVVRMYGREIERYKYPLPTGEPSSARAGQGLDTELDSIALHELVRKNSSFACRIRALDTRFRKIREAMKNGVEVTVNIMQLVKEHTAIIRKAESEIFSNCDIILCTCSAANKDRLHFLDHANRVRQLLIDEASMCTEPESLIPIMSTECEQVTLVGDHKQLGPVVLSQEAKEYGFDSSLFQRYAKHTNMLTKHYRMHKEIARFPSECFYKGLLQAGTQIQTQPSTLNIWPKGKMSPLVFCNCVGEERQSVVSTDESSEMSACNEIEANHIIRMIRKLIEVHKVKPTNIAILSQYRAQIGLISSLLPQAYQNQVRVLTVITSQGDEWDYVFFTTVRSCPEAAIDWTPSVSWKRKHLGFITDERQVNVAITRSKKGMIIIGNQSLLSVDKTWKQLLHSYKERGLIVEAKNFLTR